MRGFEGDVRELLPGPGLCQGAPVVARLLPHVVVRPRVLLEGLPDNVGGDPLSLGTVPELVEDDRSSLQGSLQCGDEDDVGLGEGRWRSPITRGKLLAGLSCLEVNSMVVNFWAIFWATFQVIFCPIELGTGTTLPPVWG